MVAGRSHHTTVIESVTSGKNYEHQHILHNSEGFEASGQFHFCKSGHQNQIPGKSVDRVQLHVHKFSNVKYACQ